MGAGSLRESPEFFHVAVAGMFALGVLTITAVSYVVAPYGRHVRKGFGPQIPARFGWILMESPSTWFFMLVYSWGRNRTEWTPLVLFSLYQLHYWQRVVVYPFRMRANGKLLPISVALAAFSFNIYNSYLQASLISHFGSYTNGSLSTLNFRLGALLFFAGFCGNVWADSTLLGLRNNDADKTYKIPYGPLYEYISCPNYLAEMIEWCGWALMTWSFTGLAFLWYTAANLGPRALANHRWYKDKFDEYPKSRKALIPYIL